LFLAIVQTLATIAALAAAVATFLTVREMKAQREDALLIEFTLGLTDALVFTDGDGGLLGDYRWVSNLRGDQFEGLALANVGPSPAKAVRIHWQVDYPAAIARLNDDLAEPDDPDQEVRLSLATDGAISVAVGGSEDQRWLDIPEVQWAPYVLPYAISKEEIAVPIPFRVRRLCELAYEAWIRDGLGDRHLLHTLLTIDFEDLQSQQQSRSFSLEFRSFEPAFESDTEAFGVVVGEPDVLQMYGLR